MNHLIPCHEFYTYSQSHIYMNIHIRTYLITLHCLWVVIYTAPTLIIQACALFASFHMFRVSMVDKGLVTAIVGASLRKPKDENMKHSLDSIELATGMYIHI